IKRQSDINGGIYTAKAVKGKYIRGGKPPYGYRKEYYEEGKKMTFRLVIHEAEAEIVKYIFEAFLADTPVYLIKETAKKLGFDRTGNSAIDFILRNPIYYGYQDVKPWKN